MKFKKLLCIVLTLVFLSGVSVVLADPWPVEEEEVKTTVFYRGQEYLPEDLTVDQMKEALGWYMGPPKGMSTFAVPESGNPLRSDRANQPSFIVDNYGDEIANRIDALRPRLVGDIQGAVKINSWGSYNNSGASWPFPSVTEMGNYYAGIAADLGLRVRIVPANSTTPPISSATGTAYVIVEVGPEDAVECVMILTHMDTQTDSLRFDYESSINSPNPSVLKHWDLGGFLSGKEIIDPVTGRQAIVGRGTDDDKVTGIPEMYALKALKESGVPLKRRVQLLLGTGEENAGSPGANAFARLETFPKVSYVADVSDGSLRLTQNQMWYARGVLSWDNPSNDNIKLRFPAALPRDEYALSNTSAAGGSGTFARWKATYDAYHVGSLVGSTQASSYGNWGLQLKTVAWLVCDEESVAGLIYADAMELRKTYIKKYYTYLQNQNYYKPFIVEPTNIDAGPAGAVNPRIGPDGAPEYGRWDIGIDVQVVKSPGSDLQNTVQIIARGMNWRYTEQYGQNSRQILMDFLANLNLPAGKTARWQEAMKRIAKVFPYGQAEPGKDTWRAAHLFDTVGVQAYFHELTPSLTTAPGNRNMTIASQDWEIDVVSNVTNPTAPAARTVNYVGQNMEDVGQLYFELRFLYPMAPFDDDWFKPSAEANNRDYLPTVQAEKVRAAMAAAGIGTTTLAAGSNYNSTTAVVNGISGFNQTSGGSGINNTTAYGVPTYYSSYTHDCVQFALRSTNAYYKANDIPWRETLCGQAGTNYGTIFRVSNINYGNVNGFTAPPHAGTAVGLGHWGGKNGLHSFNERVEPDGLIGFANRVATVLGDAAHGRYHTYDVSGNGNTQPRMVLRLENVQTTPTYSELSNSAYTAILKEDVYIPESSELPDIITALEAKGILPTDPDIAYDFLFGRKFLMKGIPAGGNFELTVKVGAPEKDFTQHLLVVGELADGSGWDIINNNVADKLQTLAKVAPGSKFDKAVASADIVNTRIITFLITEPDEDDGGGCGLIDDDCKEQIKDWLEDICENGCNAGIPMLAIFALAGLMLRRKF
ncbi:MAG: M20/M25/M40 family metallo-hydrolase [Synergistaceae bacterium]|nr:M20/M25/M40 family metallo-hydrolase [Synergistaceae bacterium]